MAEGFELDIITAVLLGGVSIFGGKGNLVGVGLSLLVILNLRNGMGLADITGNTQNYVIGGLLILSVLIPNMWQDLQKQMERERNMRKLLIGAAALAMLALLPQCAFAAGRDGDARQGRQHGAAAEIPRHSAVRPGA